MECTGNNQSKPHSEIEHLRAGNQFHTHCTEAKILTSRILDLVKARTPIPIIFVKVIPESTY